MSLSVRQSGPAVLVADSDRRHISDLLSAVYQSERGVVSR